MIHYLLDLVTAYLLCAFILLPQTHPRREPESWGPLIRLTQDERVVAAVTEEINLFKDAST